MQDVETFYPLSPLQQGLLFHSLSEPESGMYFNQTLATLEGDLDVEAFRAAWQEVVDRHAILRTFFVWEGVERPIQVVKRDAKMPFALEDLRGRSAEAAAERTAELLRRDLERGFDLSRAPLMRALLIRTAERRYELLWSFHHILMDGWSMFRVLEEFFRAYDARRAGTRLEVDPPRPFRDHIVWLERQSLAEAESFWRARLAGFTAPTPLPVDRAAEARTLRDEFASRELFVPAETTAALESFARKHRLTLNTIFQAAWGLLMSRYSGEDDVVFGTIVSGRPAELDGVESMVGLFINSLPVRVRLDPEESVLAWLERLQRELTDLREYEYSPLAEVQRWSDVGGGEALFETLLLFENYKKDSSIEEMSRTLAITDIQWFERHNFPIAAIVIPGDEVTLRISYQCARFSEATIERMLGHWRILLEGILSAPNGTTAELGLLSSAERRLLLDEWNDTAAEIPAVCAHELFEACVDRAADALAVVAGGESLSYGELEARANRLAHRLRSLGVRPGELVAICTGRSVEMVVGILATQKAGGAYLPLDDHLPPKRLEFMLTDADVRVVLTGRALRADTSSALGDQGAALIVLDEEWDSIATEPETRLDPTARPNDLAYVIYTSGSTGTPKGVELEHAGLVNLLTWHQRTYDVGPEDRATHLAGLGFDASVWELWPYLTAGASLYLVDEDTRMAPANLLRFFAEHGITHTFVPTPMAEAILHEDQPANLALEWLLTGGDKLNRAPERELSFKLVNHYGPTENTVVATAVEVPARPDDTTAPTIGRPIQNVRCFVLDHSGRPVAIGVPGELYVGGRSLARGYRQRAELTAEKFAPSPLDPSERLYATGDLVRWRYDGELEFLGRIDDQVKVRGFRIELGEIEFALTSHPHVREAVVLARDEGPGSKALVAYLVAAGASAPAQDELRRYLKDRLPEYMVPAVFMTLASFPKSASGKVDRRALPVPDAVRPELETTFAAPEAEIERTIAAIWRDVLALEKVGIHDNFFDLGGHSLHLIRVHGRLANDLARAIPMVDMFKYPTIDALAKYLGSEADDAPEPSEPNADVDAGKARLRRLQSRRRE